MDDAANEKLRFDTRLARREGWVAPEDLAQELASLPDVSDKVKRPSSEEPAAPSSGGDGSVA